MSNLPEIADQRLKLRQFSDPAPSSICRRPPAPRDITNTSYLTRRQKLAIENALKPGMTKKAALLKAGYALSVAEEAWAFFSKPAIAHEFNRRKNEIFSKLELTTDEVVDGLRKQASFNILDYYEVDPDNPNRVYVDLRKITSDQADVIQAIEYDAQGRLRLQFESKKACRELLGRYLGLGDKKVDNSGLLGDNDKPLTIQALDNLIKEELSRQNQNITINIQQNNFANKDNEALLAPAAPPPLLEASE